MKKRRITTFSCRAAAAMISGALLFTPVASAANSSGTNDVGVTYTASIEEVVANAGDKTQTVIVTVRTNKQVAIDSMGGNVKIPEGFQLTAVENDILGFGEQHINLENGYFVYYTPDAENIWTDHLITLHYTAPADLQVGNYDLGIDIDCISQNYGTVVWEKDAAADVTFHVRDESHVHSMILVAAKEATCAQSGNHAYWICSECRKAYKDESANQPTTGSAESIAKLTAHAWGDWIADKVKEEEIRECTVCHETERRDIEVSEPVPEKPEPDVPAQPQPSVPVQPTPVIPEVPATSAFKDVAQNVYYFKPVQWAVFKGITSGTTADTFSPDATCTRAQAVVFLWRAAGSPAPENRNMPFTDVADGTYYHDAVLWAVETGITSGTSATTFGPDATCTRAQIVTFLWRAQGIPAVNGTSPFTDVAESAYYNTPVQWAVKYGITAGTTATTFDPDANCTRGQIVTFLYRNYVD